MRTSTFFTACSLVFLAGARTLQLRESDAPFLQTVFQFSNIPSWIENLVVRDDGTLLVTRTDVPELWSVNPFSHTASLIYTFPAASGCVGILEYAPKVFAVMCLEVTLATATALPGSGIVWKVDLSKPGSTPIISQIAALKESIFLNGITLLDETALISDSTKGVIWRLNLHTGAHSIALSDPTMLPAPGAPIPIGINGIKVHRGYVYFTSTTQEKFCRVPFNKDGRATGPVEVLATGSVQDDLILTRDGRAYIATNSENTIVEWKQGQKDFKVIAGNLNSSAVAGSTAVQFARKGNDIDEETLYVTTSGGLAAPVNGTFTEPGKVVKIMLDC